MKIRDIEQKAKGVVRSQPRQGIGTKVLPKERVPKHREEASRKASHS
jgi:hypothetical protein